MQQLLYDLAIALMVAMAAGTATPSSSLPGHMEPLGSHRPPEQLERLAVPPSPLEFAGYVSRRQPVVIEQLMTNTEVLRNWQNDNYLRERFGHINISAENGKKENRSAYGSAMNIREYLDRYKSEDIYLVADMPDELREEWVIPKFLLCGGYTENIIIVYMWFSSGGTKSVLHSDSSENLHCVVSGQKRFVIIDPKYASNIGQEYFTKGYFDVDVDKVDMTVYGGLAEVPWMLAEVNAGDCLYIPLEWLHQVNSFGRNFGVNVWWIPFQFRQEECVHTDHLPLFGALREIRVSPELQAKQFLMDIARPDGTIHVEDAYKLLVERQKDASISIDKMKVMFEILQPGCGGVLTMEKLNDLSLETFKEAEKYIMSLLEEEAEGMNSKDGPMDDVHGHGQRDEL